MIFYEKKLIKKLFAIKLFLIFAVSELLNCFILVRIASFV